MTKKLTIILAVIACFGVSVASAQSCANVYKLSGKGAITGIKYKDANVHGGRGMSFIVQNKSEWDSKLTRLQMRDINCNLIGYLGLQKETLKSKHDSLYCPYGKRFYSKVSGGSYFSPSKATAKAKAGSGSGVVLIQLRNKGGVTDRWARVKSLHTNSVGSLKTYPHANSPGGVCWKK